MVGGDSMTVPTSVEVLLVEQIYWLQRKILENKDDYVALNVIFDLLLSQIAYITGKSVSNEIARPVLAKNMPHEVKVENLLKAILRLNEELSILLRNWIDKKREMAMLGGGF